jgi:hypothetical protein
MNRGLLIGLLAGLAIPLNAAVYYVRPDGGSAVQCNGTSNLPYPGTGSNAVCAWDHPFRALPPGGEPRISGGDTLFVASGSYMMGFGAPESDRCEAGGAWNCHMPPIPGGPSPANPTRITGDCSRRPELWGTERAELVVNLTGSSNVELACFEITDHSTCVEFHSGAISCQRDVAPFGPWAARGIYAADSANVTLRELDIHGLASIGIHAGRLRDWTVTDVRIAANGSAGWDGDIDGDDSDEGTMRFLRWTVEWNGCGETYPGRQPAGCWAQSAGGYGDGVGTGETRGRWIVEESSFLYNTSDGLDLLYVRPGGSVEIRRTIARGNAGNQIKTSGPALIESSLIVGNCGWFDTNPVSHQVDNCRANGNAVSLTFFRGDRVSIVNTTIASEGDCTIIAGCAEGAACDGSERLTLRNNILIGGQEFLDPGDRSCDLFTEGIGGIDQDYTIAFGTKINHCGAAHDQCNVDPLVVRAEIDGFDGRLRKGSPAIGAAESASATATDVDGRPRDSRPDIGAHEYVEPGRRTRAVRRR